MKTLRELQGQRTVTRKQLIQIQKQTSLDLIEKDRVKEAVRYTKMSLEEFAKYTGRIIKEKKR